MENYITIATEDGQKFQAEVIDIFGVDEYPNKDYIIYSFGEVNNDDEKVYVSIIEDKGEIYNLKEINDPTEWKIVQEAINNTINDEGEVNGE